MRCILASGYNSRCWISPIYHRPDYLWDHLAAIVSVHQNQQDKYALIPSVKQCPPVWPKIHAINVVELAL